jgi:DNA polymerase-1
MLEVDLLLIDGDELLYKAAAGFEHEAAWDIDKNIWTTWTETGKAVQQVVDQVVKAQRKYEPRHTVFCTSGDTDFRYDVAADYKSDRKKVRKPTGYIHVRDSVLKLIDQDFTELPDGLAVKFPGTTSSARYDNIEADDCMGILATKPGNESALIISQDKDMRQIPGMLATYIGAEPKMVTEYEGARWFLTQTLIGDTTDGYKGCPGVGPAGADKLFDQIRTHDPKVFIEEGWKHVVAAYAKAGLTEADALVQARLARILQWSDWDYTNKQPKLWVPPHHE